MMSPVTITTTLTNGHELLNGHMESKLNGKLEPKMLNGKLELINDFRKNGFAKPDTKDPPVSNICYLKDVHSSLILRIP